MNEMTLIIVIVGFALVILDGVYGVHKDRQRQNRRRRHEGNRL